MELTTLTSSASFVVQLPCGSVGVILTSVILATELQVKL